MSMLSCIPLRRGLGGFPFPTNQLTPSFRQRSRPFSPGPFPDCFLFSGSSLGNFHHLRKNPRLLLFLKRRQAFVWRRQLYVPSDNTAFSSGSVSFGQLVPVKRLGERFPLQHLHYAAIPLRTLIALTLDSPVPPVSHACTE